MSRLRTCSEVQEAAALLGQIAADTQRAGASRGERLERALAQMCARGHLRAAAVIDEQGLPLAVHDSPLATDVIGALASVLGHALDHAGQVLGRGDARQIAVDVGLDEKTVVRRFESGDATHYLIVLCPLEVDERAEIELTLAQLASIVRVGGNAP